MSNVNGWFEITKYEKGGHVAALDGVRGLAVLLVLLFHFFNVGFGWVGVDLFFVLSGFLITGILIDAKGKKNYFTNFYARRTLRIFPLYYVVLIIFFLLLIGFGNQLRLKDSGFYTDHAGWFFLYMQNWLFGLEGWPQTHVLNHFWSLAIEEQFYIFWPLIVYLLPIKRLGLACIIIIALSILLRYLTWYGGITSTPFQYVATICRLDGLGIGALIAVLIRTNTSFLSQFAKWIFLITIPITLILYMKAQTLKYDNYYYLTLGFTVFDLFCGGLLITCFTSGFTFLQRFFSLSVIRFLGKYSYGIYIYHWIIYQLLWPFYKDYFTDGGIISLATRITYGCICLILTLLISKISYDYFEGPVLRLKRRFV